MTSARHPRSPSISVVITSYRRVDRLPPLVAVYVGQGADEVILVLDGPHAGWAHDLGGALDDPRVRVLELKTNRGLALARIAGLEASSGDVVLAVDDDVEPGADFVRRHRDFHRGGGDRVLLGYMPVALPRRRRRDEAPTYLYARDYEVQADVWRRSDSGTILKSLWGGTISLPRDLYARAEASRPSQRLEYNEDLDLGLRLLSLGATAVFDDTVRATHHHARGLQGFLQESTARGGAIAELEERWGRRPAQLTPLIVIPSGTSRMLALVQRRIAARDRPGLAEHLIVVLYRSAGLVRMWRLQDAIARLLRRALAMRGYRAATVTR